MAEKPEDLNLPNAVISRLAKEAVRVYYLEVWENLKKLWIHAPAAHVPTAFLVLPNFHSCFYNLIETQYMFSIS